MTVRNPAFARPGLACWFAIGALALMNSVGNDAAAQQQAGPAWLVTCDNRENAKQLNCTMVQVLSNAQTAQRVLSARIANEQGGERLYLSLPHGLDLPSGVSLSIDGGPASKVEIKTADANGSYASLKLGSDLVSAMKAGNTLAVDMVAVNGQPTKLELSLAGFNDAYALFSQAANRP